MSINLCKSYFRNIGLQRGLQEHRNPFSWADIPSTNFDRAFHIEAVSFPGVKQNQIDLEMEIPVTVRLFIRGFSYVYENEERIKSECEAFFTLALKASNRIVQTGGIKNVRLISIFVEPFAESNDNWIVGRMEFSIKFIKPIESEA
jgi:hypothetical protein